MEREQQLLRQEVERMHKFAKQIADCLKAKAEGKGIDNIEGSDLEELKIWSEIIKNIVCYDKDYKIIEEMDEEKEKDKEDEKYFIKMLKEEYGMEDEEEARRYYRGQPRSRTSGRFMSRGDGRRSNVGGRRGYEEHPMYFPEVYNPMEYMRDMDRDGMGRMYYSDGVQTSGVNTGSRSTSGQSGNYGGENTGNTSGGNVRGYSDGYNDGMKDGESRGRSQSESQYDRNRRGYQEAKEMHKDNSAEGKQAKMRELEKYMKSISEDLTEAIEGASPEEKSMLKSKLQTLAAKV